ncbi:hypothetical protein [Microvirga thermotolerans]|uniref:hypothetical protein n=1 Tax=Microvirga thermotolerans TaxID=2651334 RepID=UPI001FEBC28B|nr:hypothetical protein [Microvirga thermotolerans]
MTANQLLLARFVVVVAAVLVGLGLVWYGFSTEVLGRIWRNIAERPSGPLTFRFVLQPTMAAIVAFRDGTTDARLNRSPYLWTLLTDRNGSAERLREGVIATARIILLGFVMDGIYQAFVLDAFFPAETVLVAILLAFLPYLLLRGPFCRLAGWWLRRRSADAAS